MICRCLPASNILAGANNSRDDDFLALGVMPPVSQLLNVLLAGGGDEDPPKKKPETRKDLKN